MAESDERRTGPQTEPDGGAIAPAHPMRRRTDRPRRNRHLAALATIMLAVLMIGLYYAFRKSDAWLIHFNRHQTVRDVSQLNARMMASGLSVTELGRVEYDGAWQPLLVARRSVHGARKRLCVFAGVHGNEPGSVEAGMRIVEQLGREPGLYPGINVVAVPLVNPWGWARNLRHNGVNRDISRSFTRSPSAEGELIKGLLANEPCDLVADLHGDRAKGPFYIITYDNADVAVARALSREVRAQGVMLRAGAPDGVFNRRDLEAAALTRPNLALYARRKGVPRVYIVQTPRQLEIEQRVRLHLLAVDRLARSLAP